MLETEEGNVVEGVDNPPPDLWVHRETIALIANTHDVWSFTPEFLLMEGIVPESWLCQRASRTPDEAQIDYGPVKWSMTEERLWITFVPNSPISQRRISTDSNLVPNMARRYLEQVPYLPFVRAWFNWSISTTKTRQLEQMLKNLLPSEWPEEFEVTANQARPLLQFAFENHSYQVTFQNQVLERGGGELEDAIVFECYAFPSVNQPLDRAIPEMNNWSVRRQILQRAILHLIGDVTT